MANKFSNADRNLVVKRLEEKVGKLDQPTRRHKLLRDKSNIWYVVVGGEKWHGINKDIVDAIATEATTARLVVARKDEKSISIFLGDFATFQMKKDSLPFSIHQQYQFHVEGGETELRVCEIPGYSLFLLDVLNNEKVNQMAVPPDSAAITQMKRQLDELQSDSPPQTPQVLRKIQRLLKSYERPSPITRYVKRTRGATCQLCGELGFVKRNGKRYCEVHHLFHLSANPPPKCLAPEYLVVLCGTCHRRMHYADVGEPLRDGVGWRVRVDEREYRFVVG